MDVGIEKSKTVPLTLLARLYNKNVFIKYIFFNVFIILRVQGLRPALAEHIVKKINLTYLKNDS